VRTPHLIGSVASKEHDPERAQIAGKEGQQIQGRPIGPMQILQNRHDLSGVGKFAEQRKHGLKESRLFMCSAVGGPSPLVRKETGQLGTVQLTRLIRSERAA
jgi:hypothetical protein